MNKNVQSTISSNIRSATLLLSVLESGKLKYDVRSVAIGEEEDYVQSCSIPHDLVERFREITYEYLQIKKEEVENL